MSTYDTTETVAPAPPSPFVACLRGKAGEELRAVVQYGESGQERLYGEPAVEPPERLVADLRGSGADETRREAVAESGALHAVVRMYGERLVVHFPQGGAVGTVVTLDHGLNQFVRGALVRLAEGDQEVEAIPDRY